MAYDSEWCTDFCLSCDRQTSEGPYCSHSCRMADLQKAGSLSPDYQLCNASDSSSTIASWDSFAEPVGVNFPSATVDHNIYYSPLQTTSAHNNFLHHQEPTERPSNRSSVSSVSSIPDKTYASSFLSRRARPSSWTSFTSMGTTLTLAMMEQPYTTSTTTIDHISDEARNQLRAYESRFDHARRKRLQFAWQFPAGAH